MDNKVLAIRTYYNDRYSYSSLKHDINYLYEHFVKAREEALLDAASSAVALSSFLSDSGMIDSSAFTPQMREAFRLAFPNTSLPHLLQTDPSALYDYLPAWKGKYFEIIVRNKLNAGDWVGDIHLASGQTAQLAENISQPGWDLQINNPDGTIDHVLQLKATASLSYVQEALQKYPDISILTTNEVFEQSNELGSHLLNSGVSNETLQHDLTAPLLNLHDGHSADFIDSILPGLPFLIIAFGEGRKVMVGRKSFEAAFSSFLSRGIKTGVSIGVGGIVHALDGGILSIPATILTRLGIDRFSLFNKVEKDLQNRITQLNNIYSTLLLT